MKIFLLLIILNFSIFASENLDINKNSATNSQNYVAKLTGIEDEVKKIILEEVKNQIKENDEKKLTLVYNIDQIYQSANNFYTTAFNHL